MDCTSSLAGSLAAMLLADLGAERLRVVTTDEAAAPGRAMIAARRNARRTALDARRAADRPALEALLASADVAVFDEPARALEAAALDARHLRELSPSLLHVSIPPYGSSDRWDALPADHALLSAISGVAFMQHSADDQPVHLVSPQIWYGQAMLAAAAIAAGLVGRGNGAVLEPLVVSGVDAVAAIKTGTIFEAGEVVRLGGQASTRGAGPNYRLYQCSDGAWLFLGCLRAPFFIRALELLDLLELLTMPGVEGEFTQLQTAPYNQMAIEQLEARFAERPREEWLELLDDPLVPISPVQSSETWFESETARVNDMRVALDHPALGRIEMPGVPLELRGMGGGHALEVEAADAQWRARAEGGTAKRPGGAGGSGPLAGVRVLDLATFIAGAFTSTVLANFGAEVIKVEPPDGDPWRTQGLGFIAWNRGKRSLVVDLKREEGREVLYELVRSSDVVVDNYRVGVRERLKVDYEHLSQLNPDIVTCSITAYGTRGPLAREPGFDTVVQARSGMMAAQGGAEEPVTLRMSPIDTLTAITGAFGIAAALCERQRTGVGTEVETSLARLSVFGQFEELVELSGGRAPSVGGRDFLGPCALRRFYQCRDGWIAVRATQGDREHLRAAVAGSSGGGERARGSADDDALGVELGRYLLGRSREEALTFFEALGVAAAPAIRQEEIGGDAFLQAELLLDEYEHPDHGPVRGVRGYGRWGGRPLGFDRRAPLLGEHTMEVLEEFGVATESRARLLEEAVIRQAG